VEAFVAHDEPPADREERWRGVLHDAVGPLEPEGIPERFVGGRIGALHVAEITSRAPCSARLAPTGLRSSDPDMCKIDVVSWGRAAIDQDGRQAILGPGDLALVDLARPAAWSMTAVRVTALAFPRTLLSLQPCDMKQLAAVRIGGDTALGALASSVARQMPSHLEDSDAADAVRLSAVVLELLSMALARQLDRSHAARPHVRQLSLSLQIEACIDRRLAEPQLNPQAIASELGISVRYLHKLFESRPYTVAGWIRRQRLERCRRDLLDPSLYHRPVSALAARWCFFDPGHFCRVFANEYGVPPGLYRRSMAPAKPD
jgi:AraC-like DNA-binding protein